MINEKSQITQNSINLVICIEANIFFLCQDTICSTFYESKTWMRTGEMATILYTKFGVVFFTTAVDAPENIDCLNRRIGTVTGTRSSYTGVDRRKHLHTKTTRLHESLVRRHLYTVCMPLEHYSDLSMM